MMLGIIPARKGSKGIKDKNNKKMCGKTLIEWTRDVASGLMPLVITTDYEQDFGMEKIYRPKNLCHDEVPMLPVIQHAIEEYEKRHNIIVTSICLLQPTSPLKTAKDIKRCIDIYEDKKEPVISGYCFKIKQDNVVFDKHKTKYHFQRNGAIFISTREMIKDGYIFNKDSIKYEMPMSRSIDIDTNDDWFIVESILKNRKGEC